jgi:hypothetical protein
MATTTRRLTLGALLGGALCFPGVAAVEAKKRTKNNHGGNRGHGGTRNEPKQKVCLCSETRCRSQKKPRSKIKRFLKRHDCAYRGGCTGANPCAPVRVTAPFRIEAIWSGDPDYDTFLFVPRASAAASPGPFIKYDCNPDSDCDVEYPFACVSQDATGPGNEITTVHQLLAGTYEYWIQVEALAPAGELTVQLVKDGSVLATWYNPANPSGNQEIGWHVFNIDGATGQFTTAGETIDDTLPDAAHEEHEDVCPS